MIPKRIRSSNISKFIHLTRFYLNETYFSKIFHLSIVLIVILSAIMAYINFSLSYSSNFPVRSASYILHRISGSEHILISYYLWSIPFQAIIVFVASMITAFIVAGNQESRTRYLLGSLPVPRYVDALSRYAASAFLSYALVMVYFLFSVASVSGGSRTLPPVQAYISMLLIFLIVLAISAVTLFAAMATARVLVSVIIVFTAYFVILSSLDLAFDLFGMPSPVFLINNDVSAISGIYSNVNLLPFGNPGTIAPEPFTYLFLQAFTLIVYTCVFLTISISIYSWRDII